MQEAAIMSDRVNQAKIRRYEVEKFQIMHSDRLLHFLQYTNWREKGIVTLQE